MDGIHDMGGMHGFGTVEREADEPVFHAKWEGRIFAMAVATPVRIPGGTRSLIEAMDPAEYLKSSYYEKWLHARLEGLIAAGVLTREEVKERIAHFVAVPEEAPRRDDPEKVERTLERIRTHRSPLRESDATPRFGLGERVRVRVMHPAGHTRLPRYVRGKEGVVERFYGFQDFQDAVPEGHDNLPQAVYLVRFSAGELWGEDAEANASVCVDMWESYLV